MIDLNNTLDYKFNIYDKNNNYRIYSLNEKGFKDYISYDHITHKYLSKFNPKIIEYVYKNSKDTEEDVNQKNVKENNQANKLNFPKLIQKEIKSEKPSKVDIKINLCKDQINENLKTLNNVSLPNFNNYPLPKNLSYLDKKKK